MIDKLNDFVAEPLPRKILFFDQMLTPSLIRVVYWLGLISVVWAGLGHMFSHGFFGFFEGIVYIALAATVLRIAAELVMLLFKIHENCKIIAQNSQVVSAAPAKTAKKVAKKTTKKVSKKATD